MMVRNCWLVFLTIIFLTGCSSTGLMGLITKSSADPSAVLENNQAFEELGAAEGQACRYFLLAIIPWGKSDFEEAVTQALEKTGGDALLNVSVESSLYGVFPIYNVFSFTCTTVKGTAIKFK
ncbi:MAG: hypothetical protein AB7P17_15940 [Nitrospirales bacterium]|nr:hypothetical protein [Nitrospirales bacterium]